MREQFRRCRNCESDGLWQSNPAQKIERHTVTGAGWTHRATAGQAIFDLKTYNEAGQLELDDRPVPLRRRARFRHHKSMNTKVATLHGGSRRLNLPMEGGLARVWRSRVAVWIVFITFLANQRMCGLMVFPGSVQPDTSKSRDNVMEMVSGAVWLRQWRAR
jgi:hypothetical protein